MTDDRIAELLGWQPERRTWRDSSLMHRIRLIVAEAQAEQSAPSIPEISDDLIEAIESRAEQSYRRHHRGIRGQQLTPADALLWHIIHATRYVLVEAMEAKPCAPPKLPPSCAACNPSAIRALLDRLKAVEGELETERMRLSACGVVALANTPESASKAREMLPEYRSASLDDVERAVDEQMRLRSENERLRAALDELGVAIADAGYTWTPAMRTAYEKGTK